jgi:hypothetical protein
LEPGGTSGAKVAVTDRLEARTRAQVPVPAQSPLQPEKVQPLLAAGVNETGVPRGWAVAQLPDEQLVATGVPLTVPPLLT